MSAGGCLKRSVQSLMASTTPSLSHLRGVEVARTSGRQSRRRSGIAGPSCPTRAPYAPRMAYDTAEARQEMLDTIADALDDLGVAAADLGEAYELLDDTTADRLEGELFKPVQTASGRLKRTHTGFAQCVGLVARAPLPRTPGPPSQGVRGFVTHVTLNCYDDLNRVVRVETGTATMPPAFCEDPAPASTSSDWWSYGFDLAGNITGSQRKGATQQSFAYADGNRLCWKNNGASTNTCATPPAGATTYTYDAAGQETGVSGGRASTYNARQQLTSVTGVTGIGYFATGQSDLTTAGGSTHRSGVLGLSQIGSDSYVRDESGGLVSQVTATGRKYVQTDALGSVRALTDTSGTVTTRLDYDPYGATTSTATPGAATSRFGYAQGENIGAGLTHYGERYYDPAIMRWTQPDPLLNEGDIREANRYAYVGGDPVNLSDAAGTSPAPPGSCSGTLCVSQRPYSRRGGTGAGGYRRNPYARQLGRDLDTLCYGATTVSYVARRFPAVAGGCIAYGGAGVANAYR